MIYNWRERIYENYSHEGALVYTIRSEMVCRFQIYTTPLLRDEKLIFGGEQRSEADNSINKSRISARMAKIRIYLESADHF